MKQENWINQLIEASAEIPEVEPSAFLYERIQRRIQDKEETKRSSSLSIASWSVAASILILLNIFIMLKNSKSHSSAHDEYSSIHSISNSFNQSTTYNY